MKKFDLKEHTSKYMQFAKAAGNGSYPNKRAATIGSKIGLGIGGALFCAGIYGLAQDAVFGIGSLLVGVLAIISNMLNLKRIKSK